MKKFSKFFILFLILFLPTFVKAETNLSSYSYNDFVGVVIEIISIIYFVYIYISLLSVFYMVIVRWKLFKKAGKNGWEAIIPFYSTWVLFEISGYPGYYIFFSLIPIPCIGSIIYLVFKINAYLSLSKKFEKSGAFSLLLIFFPAIGFSILAFGKSKYVSSNGENPSSNEMDEDSITTKVFSDSSCSKCGSKLEEDDIFCTKCGNKR